MIRTSAPFASWILQRQLTEMKEAAVTAMRHVGELADLVRFLPGFFGSITSHVKKCTSRAPEMGHFATYKPHSGWTCRLYWVLGSWFLPVLRMGEGNGLCVHLVPSATTTKAPNNRQIN